MKAAPITNRPAAAGPIAIYRPDAAGVLQLVVELPPPSDPRFAAALTGKRPRGRPRKGDVNTPLFTKAAPRLSVGGKHALTINPDGASARHARNPW